MGAGRHRVLYVQRFGGGGAVTGLYELVRGLDRERFQPVVLFYEPNDYADAFRRIGAEVLTLGPTARPKPRRAGGADGGGEGASLRREARRLRRLVREDWPLARRIARVIREARIDLVHHNDNPRAHRASILAAAMARVPQVCHSRSFTRYAPWIDRPLCRRVDAFLYMSAALEAEAHALGVPAPVGRVLDDPLDLERFAAAERQRAETRRALGLHDDDWVVSHVGRLVEWKGQDYFLRAIGELRHRFPDVRALIVGSADASPGSLAFEARLHALVRELDLEGHVRFLGFRSDVAEVMAASEVVVHSSSQPEPFGLVVIEAMAAGRAVVATAAGGPLEVITHAETGLLVPLRDAAGIAAALTRLAGDEAFARRLGERGREYTRQRFAPERYTTAIHTLYERLLARRPAASALPEPVAAVAG